MEVVLVRPKLAENVGAACRAVANMGLGGVRLVEPAADDPVRARALATRAGEAVLARVERHPDLASALADCAAAVATTARRGEDRGELLPPRAAAPGLVESAGLGRVALVFGPEDKGLTNAEVDACGKSVCIPTDAAASLNLAQAVVVLAYELRVAAMEAKGWTSDGRKPAPLDELMALEDHLTQALVAIGTLPADNPAHFFRPLRAVLRRARPSSREVRAWRGIARQCLWLAGRLGRC